LQTNDLGVSASYKLQSRHLVTFLDFPYENLMMRRVRL